ncbi:MAG: tRNA pseudouridine(38-40) synthase TruA [Dictyoglomus thermophilum]|nr:tRNA pseudouridine(38-40) synthase TruA [Dictyoglomus thermophilum]MCX7721410.1 tRNA pseudouridine(38-40) synthase TruA [Dictyoglomus thermophilum]
MINWKVELSYIGKDFWGFQKQPGKRTVQGELEKVLKLLFDEDIKVIGAGRTDAGVHALGQVVNFKTKESKNFSCDKLYKVLNKLLPGDIKIKKVEIVDDNFHARYSAKRRWYIYVIYNNEEKNLFLRDYCWWINKPLDKDLLNLSANLFKGIHDFRNFCVIENYDNTNVEIYESFWYFKKDLLIYFASAPFFLRKMVRFIVGSMVEVGLKKKKLEDLEKYLKYRKEERFSSPAPASGLYLFKIDY